jgi:T5SS/PEP-CTERM-associated repeat protein
MTFDLRQSALMGAALMMLLVAVNAVAQTTWTGPTGAEGNWTDIVNWNNNPPPTTLATINNSGIAVIDTPAVTNVDIRIGTTAGNSGTLRINAGGTLVAGTSIRMGIASGATGTLEVAGGTLFGTNCLLTAGEAAGGAGTVTINGTVSLKNLRVGSSGTGSCTVNGGAVTLDSYDSEIATAAGSVGTFTQNGGTVTRNAVTEIAPVAGALGTYIVSNSVLTCKERVQIGNHGTGRLEIHNGATVVLQHATLANMYVPGGTGTGTVEMTGGTLTVTNLAVGGTGPGSVGTVNIRGGQVFIESYGSEIGDAAGAIATFRQTGGTVTRNAITEIGNSAGASGTYIVSNSVLTCKGNLNVGYYGVGRLEIHDGATVTVTNSASTSVPGNTGTGTVEMTGGTLTTTNLLIGAGTPSLGTFYMKSGQLNVQSYMFYIGSSDKANARFLQSGGSVSSPSLYLGRNGTNRMGRYEISGGSLNVSGVISIEQTNTAAFRLTGSAPSATMSYIRNDNSNPFLLEFVLDKSPAHLTNINFTGSGKRTGHLRVGFDGGILLTATNAFTLLRGASALSIPLTYNSVPDANMWTEALSNANKDDRITLANGYKMGALDMNSLGVAASFPARAMGHVTLANVNTNAFGEGLAVWMDVDTAPYGQTAASLAGSLVAAGYTNSMATNSPPYDLLTVIPKAYTPNGSAYFAWDFTDVTTGATNATLSALMFTTWPPPPARDLDPDQVGGGSALNPAGIASQAFRVAASVSNCVGLSSLTNSSSAQPDGRTAWASARYRGHTPAPSARGYLSYPAH